MSDARTRPDSSDTRLAVLETHVVHVREDVAELKADARATRADLAALKTDVAGIKVDVAVLKATMATKGFVVAVVVGTGAVLGAITTFAPFIQRLLGLTH